MNTVVFGRAGQLASALRAVTAETDPIEFVGRDQCDLRDPAAIARSLERSRAEVAINATAYTNVEQAEREPGEAFSVNAIAVGALANACAAQGVRLIHVSTDYVFGGTATRPYGPHATPAPLGVYGASKLEGERLIAATPRLNWLIVRTSWLYSSTGRNFLLTMLGLFRSRGTVSVVDDQFGTPTSARSLARALWVVAQLPKARGIAHFANLGVASWWEFAVAIAAAARARGLLQRAPIVNAISTAEYPTLAARPAFSALDASATLAEWDVAGIPWRDALGATLDELRAAAG